jgi:hypothetical protein
MNNNCWYSLNIDFSNALKKDWVWEIPDFKNPSIQYTRPSRIFNFEWLNYMKSIGVPIHFVMLFYKSPTYNFPRAHIDVSQVDVKTNKSLSYMTYAINWVIEGHDSEMKWYNLPKESSNVKYTSANNPYIDWPISTLTEIDSANIQNLFTLVRTDIPHSVHVNNKSRWSISVRSSSLFTWEDSVDHFRSKNLLIER